MAEKRIKEAKASIAAKTDVISDAKVRLEERTVDLNTKNSELENIIAETQKDEEKLGKESARAEKVIDERLLNAYKRLRGNVRNGLAVVPVLRETDEMSFADIEKNISELGQKARDGKITIEDLQGGTFTISNGGVYGSMLSTPILNPPQSGVLGMHNIVERPIVVNGEIKIRPVMYLALSYDHRIVDGKDSVSFLKTIKENLENPGRLFLNI